MQQNDLLDSSSTDSRGAPGALTETLGQDLRFGWRQILRRPGFSVLVAATLAVGIGANVAVFSVLKGIVLRQLPYAEPERLVAVWETPPDERWHQPFSSPDYLDVRERSRTLEEIGILRHRNFNLNGATEPAQIPGAECSASLLRLLGVPPAAGRLFSDDEEVEGNHHVVVLSHSLWQNRYGGALDVVGQPINLDGQPYLVAGVMPNDFEFPTPWGGRDESRLWVPVPTSRDDLREWHSFGAVARLAEGISVESAEAELQGIARQLAATYPATNARVTMWIEPMMQRTLSGISSTLTFLSVIVLLVLLVACANVASMLLARGAQRMPELAVRSAIGAPRARLIRQLLTESSLLSGLGGGVGLLLAYVGVMALKAALPSSVPRVAGIQIDMPVLGFAALMTLATCLLFGLAPALVSSRTNLVGALNSRPGRGGSRKLNRFLRSLVVAQLAIGFILVNAAALLLASYDNVVSQPMNFETEQTLVAEIPLGGPAYEEPHARRAFWQAVREKTRHLAGVEEVGLTSKLPLRGGSNGNVLVGEQVFEAQIKRELVEYSFIDDGYHEAMGISLIAGRGLDHVDLDASSVAAGLEVSPVELPIVINRTMAEKLWTMDEALGQLVRNNSAQEGYRARVVGIVEDVRQWGAERPALPEMYFPFTSEIWGPLRGKLVVRSSGDPRSLTDAIRTAIQQIDPQVPIANVATMGDIVRRTTGRRRFSMMLVGLFAATALMLGVAGLYGVMSYGVSLRHNEIGIRMALGSSRTGVFRLFLSDASRQVIFGLVIGIIGAFSAAATMRSMVYGISARNPMVMLATVVVMILVALVAIAVPVLRATKVNPVQVLRAE